MAHHMEITERQEKLLNFLVKEYISTSEPVSSKVLKKVTDLDVCGATIRNDLQVLTKEGFIEQPHTSAGRIPTKKAYKHFAEKFYERPASAKGYGVAKEEIFSDFIFQEIKITRGQIEEELRLAEELIKSLSEASSTLKISNISEKEDLFEILSIIGPSKTIYPKNIIIIINSIIKRLKKF